MLWCLMPNPLESFLNLNLPSMNDEIKEELSNKFLCPQKFAQDIEQIVKISKVILMLLCLIVSRIVLKLRRFPN